MVIIICNNFNETAGNDDVTDDRDDYLDDVSTCTAVNSTLYVWKHSRCGVIQVVIVCRTKTFSCYIGKPVILLLRNPNLCGIAINDFYFQ